MALPFYMKKEYLKAKKRELCKLKYFMLQKIIIFKIILWNKTKMLQDIIKNSLTNLKFQQHKPKYMVYMQ
jgi:hypothetical protein